MKTRVAITGGAGWLARELAFRLQRCEGIEVLLLGRRSQIVNVGGMRFSVHEWTDEVTRYWSPTVVVHLAYVTRERVSTVSKEEYIRANIRLRERIHNLISMQPVRHLIHVSSGAALFADESDIYGQLKRKDEEVYDSFGAALNVSVLTARAWSLSGRFCTKPKHFLFFDVLSQIQQGNQEVVITSEGEVWRKYVDAGDFLETCVRGSLEGLSGVMDSAGDLVEAAALVHRAARICGREVRVLRPNFRPDAPASTYFSRSDRMDEVMVGLGIARLSLEQQITLGLTALRSVDTSE